MTIGVAPKTAAQLPTSEWFDDDSSVSYLFGDPVASSVPGKRYALTTPVPTPATGFTVSEPVTVTGTYKTQYQVTFAQSGIGGDSTGTVVTVGLDAKTASSLPFTTDWLDSGTNVPYAYSSPVASSVLGKRYALTTPPPTPASGFAVSEAVTITGTYKTQFEVTFAQSGIGGDSTGTVVTIGITAKTAAQLPTSEWFDDDSSVSYSFTDPVASSVPGKRYVLTTPVPTPATGFTPTSPVTVTGTYKTQFEVTFAQSGIVGDSTGTVVTIGVTPKTAAQLPTSEWFDETSPVSYVFSDPVASSVAGKRYTLTTPVPTPATGFTVTGPVTVTGTYKIQFQVIFAQSGIGGDSTGTVVTVGPDAKTAANLPFTTDWLDSGTGLWYHLQQSRGEHDSDEAVHADEPEPVAD